MSRLRWWRRHDEVPVVELQKSNPVRFGLIVLVVTVVVVYFGFTKHIPFTHGFRLKGVFSSALNVRPKSPVRIAGIDVGQVSSVQRVGNTGVVTMEIADNGLPIHADATLKIRPRIFLEGNFFVELQPGSPTARTVSSGYTIPVTHTSDPVQLDQVLDALNSDTRANLQTFLAEYGAALTRKPTPAQDAEQDPDVRGLNGAQGLNKAYQRGPAALRGNAIVNQALAGVERHDLSKLVAGIGKVTAALNVHEQQLGELIGHFNTFLGSFAAQSSSLSATVAQLPGALHSTTQAFVALNAAYPPIRTFAHDLVPGVEQTPATIAAAYPWLEQAQASLAPNELGGIAIGLQRAAPAVAQFTSAQIPFQQQTAQFSECLSKVFFPAGNAVLQDGANTSGIPSYQEFWNALVGLGGAAQGFDGNGSFQRLLLLGGSHTLVTPRASYLKSTTRGEPFAASTSQPPLGTSPRYPASEPPYKPLVPCDTQALPNFNGPLSSGPADGG
jgi:phospholipid/cholesterol/gamma-HCH transport system substrate-binding protein